ncbi:MAG: hypothetical protein JOZ77_11125 [Candidatus Eremiobacteraeota bacterium]|nr:hypothetical protein [Candidatus Eremiobacteraeota bacterium]
MSLGNVPPDMLVAAVEKLLAKMDDTDLAAFYEGELSSMPSDATRAFVEALFEAFRERGESSEDAAEGAGTTLESIQERHEDALLALITYARANADLLKEATTIFVEQHPGLIQTLPPALRDALAERLRPPLEKGST